MKRWLYVFIAALVATGAVALGLLYARSINENADPLLASAVLGGEYLVRQTSEVGYFTYEYNSVTDERSPSYNILRHAGTTYAMLELYEVTGDNDLLEAAERALAFLAAQAKPCPNVPEATCIVEANDIKLGGNGLAILAFAKHAEVTGSDTYLPLAQELARFVVGVQSEAGEFTIHKMTAEGVPDDFVSGYYPGEAIFGLTRLYKEDGNRAWIDAAHKGARWLIEVRDGGKKLNELDHDHWLLYGLNELYADRVDELYLAHARKITDAIVAIQHLGLAGEYVSWNGGYYNPPRSTPTATRSEGLAAAALLFERAGDAEYKMRAIRAIERGIEFQLRTQMTKEKIEALNADADSLGGFHESLDEYAIRIDYVQHNISALLGARGLEVSQ